MKPNDSSVTTHDLNYVKNLSPEISKLLELESSWSFDIIQLERLTDKR